MSDSPLTLPLSEAPPGLPDIRPVAPYQRRKKKVQVRPPEGPPWSVQEGWRDRGREREREMEFPQHIYRMSLLKYKPCCTSIYRQCTVYLPQVLVPAPYSYVCIFVCEHIQMVRGGDIINGVRPPQSLFKPAAKRRTKRKSPPPKALTEAFDTGDPRAIEAMLPDDGAAVASIGHWVKKVGRHAYACENKAQFGYEWAHRGGLSHFPYSSGLRLQ